MDIVHTEITFLDQIRGKKTKKTTTLSKLTFDKIRASDIGKSVPYFDKVAQIRYDYIIESIEQA